jgi:hypothetical protein
VGPSVDLDELEKRKIFTLPGFELQPLDRPARSKSLYRLRYPGSLKGNVLKQMYFNVNDENAMTLQHLNLRNKAV